MDSRELTAALGGRWHGRYGTACCPAHADRGPSLSIADGDGGRALLHCFAGCPFEAVRDALRAKGLLPGHGEAPDPAELARRRREREARDRAEAAARSDAARRLWDAARPAAGTPVEAYLLARGIGLAPPPALRFLASAKHKPTGTRWPAMVAAVHDADGRLVGIHRTYLRPDGSGKAPVEPAKMALGPVAGGAIRLAEADERLQVAEGVETALAAMQATLAPTWAALGTAGLVALKLPAAVRTVVILADGDPAGRDAAHRAAERWHGEGRRVRIATPPAGLDFNDVLLGKAAAALSEASGL